MSRATVDVMRVERKPTPTIDLYVRRGRAEWHDSYTNWRSVRRRLREYEAQGFELRIQKRKATA